LTTNGTILAFVIVAAVAIVLQMVILFALYRAMRQSSARMEGIAGRLEQQASPILVATRAILEDAQPKIAEITANLAESTAAVSANITQVSEATGEIVDRVRMQAERLDEFVSSTVAKLEVTTDLVQNSVISPIRRIHAIVQAVSAGVGFLRASRSRKKAGNNDSGVDEEMFI
jgi:hypothetical protein